MVKKKLSNGLLIVAAVIIAAFFLVPNMFVVPNMFAIVSENIPLVPNPQFSTSTSWSTQDVSFSRVDGTYVVPSGTTIAPNPTYGLTVNFAFVKYVTFKDCNGKFLFQVPGNWGASHLQFSIPYTCIDQTVPLKIIADNVGVSNYYISNAQLTGLQYEDGTTTSCDPVACNLQDGWSTWSNVIPKVCENGKIKQSRLLRDAYCLTPTAPFCATTVTSTEYRFVSDASCVTTTATPTSTPTVTPSPSPTPTIAEDPRYFEINSITAPPSADEGQLITVTADISSVAFAAIDGSTIFRTYVEACVYPESWLQQWGYLALVTENIDGCTPNAFCKTKKMTWDAGGTQTVTFDNIRVPDRDTVDVTNGESAWDSNNKFQVLVGTYGKCGGPYYTNKMKPIVITPTTKDSCTTPAAEHGEKTCDGDNLERCDDGHWVLESPCPFGCDDGHWVLESPCTFGCENKACKTPGTTTTPTPTPTATPIPDCVVKDDCKAAASVTCDDGSIWYEPYDCVSGKCDIGQDAPPTDCIIVPVCADLFKDPGALLNDPLSDCNLPYTVGIVVALFVALIWFKNRKSGGSMGGINPF